MIFTLAALDSEVEPLGLMLLATALREAGHEPRLLLLDRDAPRIDWTALRTDVLGFSVLTGSHRELLALAAEARRRGIRTVVGNAHATFFPDDCLRAADVVVRGEGIRATLDIAAGRRTEGILFDSELLPADAVPEPDRELLYRDPAKRDNPIKNVMASFGCPFRCSYCYNESYERLYGPGYRVRVRSPERVVEECRRLTAWPLDLVYFQDDCFGFQMPWLETFVPLYRDRVGVPFHCQMRVEHAGDRRLALLKEAGCQGVTVALESSNPRLRRERLNRRTSNACMLEACRRIKRHGLRLRTEQMLGIPGSTIEDDLELLDWNCRVQPDVAWASLFVPYPGTRLGRFCAETGLYTEGLDGIGPSFFAESRLRFDPAHRERINALHKLYPLLARLPDGAGLARAFLDEGRLDFPSLFENTRRHLYRTCLFAV